MSDFLNRVKDKIKNHEGYSSTPYKDHLGNWTIGNGILIDPIPKDLADLMFDFHFDNGLKELRANFPWMNDSPSDVVGVMLDLVFNLGLPRLKLFVRMLQALETQNYEMAADELLDSRYARQVKGRAIENARLLRYAK